MFELVGNKNYFVITTNVDGQFLKSGFSKDAFFVEDNNWSKLNGAYNKFINANKDKKLLLIQLSVGFNTPGIIRYPFESMTLKFKNATLLRVNDKYPHLAYEIQDKAILVKDDCNRFLSILILL